MTTHYHLIFFFYVRKFFQVSSQEPLKGIPSMGFKLLEVPHSLLICFLQMIILCRTTQFDASCIQRILQLYQDFFELLMNLDNSEICFSQHVPNDRKMVGLLPSSF